MSGGVQFTPFGMIPLGAPIPQADEVSPGAVPVTPRSAPSEVIVPMYAPVRPDPSQTPFAMPPMAAEPSAHRTTPVTPVAKPVTGRELLKAARARVRELDKILRTMPALKAERDAMQRLVDAATPKRPRLVAMKAAGN